MLLILRFVEGECCQYEFVESKFVEIQISLQGVEFVHVGSLLPTVLPRLVLGERSTLWPTGH